MDPSEEHPAGEQLAREKAAPIHGGLTLATMCACGHTRKYHCGLRMEVKGRCLECDCGEFTVASTAVTDSVEHVMEQIRGRLDQVEQLRRNVASLCAQLSDEELNGGRARKQWL